MLVDSGADACVFPASPRDTALAQTPSLVAANGTEIPTYGKRTLQLSFGPGHAISQVFWIAGVKRPILGANFFIQQGLIIDLAQCRLVDKATGKIHRGRGASSPAISGLRTPPQGPYQSLLHEFPDLLVQSFSGQVKHLVKHHIETTGPPLHARARRLDSAKLAAARAEFQKMEDLGIIRRSNSPWASPLHVVPKPDGSWRPCGDYRRLNAVSKDDRYPLPHIQDFNGNLVGRAVFSVVDLVRGFHQIPMAAHDIPKTAIITPFGLFEFLRMPFGLKNAAQAFQRMMDGILRGIDFVFVYLDDILVASRDQAEHMEHLRALFRLLTSHGITINQQKSRLGLPEVQYLGHLVNARGVLPLADRVTAIAQVPPPQSKVALQRFLGMVNYYRRFLPHLAQVLAPLHAAVGAAGRAKSIQWSADCQSAFQATKSALAKATLLHHPDPAAQTALTVDASDVAVGAELSQLRGAVWEPIAFFSRKLSPPEVKYSAFDRELLGMYLATKHFRHYLEGRPFAIFTDHKPLVFALGSDADRSPRQTRHLSFIAEFTTDIRHIPGPDNVVADALSRAVAAVQLPSIDFSVVAAHQRRSAREMEYYQSLESGIAPRQVKYRGQDLWCDVSTGRIRPIIPAIFAKEVFAALHCLSHAGPRPTLRAVAERFVWRGMRRDVRLWCRECHPCQASKIAKHTRAPVQHFQMPQRRFGDLHVDLVGPLPPSEG